MKKIILFLFSLTLFYSCSERKKTPITKMEVSDLKNEPLLVYVSNPKKTDILCISEIDIAKKNIAKNGISFIQTIGFGFGHKRYERELKELCKQEGLVYEIELISCVVLKDQTQGCYGAFMDKTLNEIYGIGFKNKMYQKADSLFLQNIIKNNTLVYYGDCNERPKLPSENEKNLGYIPPILVENLNIIEDTSKYGGWPFFDIGFTVEKDSTINDFHINSFFNGLPANKKYKKELFELAKHHLKEKYPIWTPGIVNGVQVRTDNNVRIHLTKEQDDYSM